MLVVQLWSAEGFNYSYPDFSKYVNLSGYYLPDYHGEN